MTEREHSADPIPPEWLPESSVPRPDDAGYWDQQLQRLMAEADPVLTGYRRPRPAPAPWWQALALRWRPAVGGAFAVAATLVLLFAIGIGPGAGSRSRPDPDAVVLSAVVGDGEPAALWSGAGVEADPVLALLVLQGQVPAQGGER